MNRFPRASIRHRVEMDRILEILDQKGALTTTEVAEDYKRKFEYLPPYLAYHRLAYLEHKGWVTGLRAGGGQAVLWGRTDKT